LVHPTSEAPAVTEPDWIKGTDPDPMLAYLGHRTDGRKFRLFACACCRCTWHLLDQQGSREAVAFEETCADGTMASWDPRSAAAEAARSAAARAAREERAAEAARRTVRKAQAAADDRVRAAEKQGRAAREKARGSRAAWERIDETEGVAAEAEQAARLAHASAAAARAVQTMMAGVRPADEVAAQVSRLAAAAVRIAAHPAVAAAAMAAERKAQADLVRCIFRNAFRPSLVLEPPGLRWNGGVIVRRASTVYAESSFGTLPVLADALEEAGLLDPAVLGHCRGPGPHARGCHVLDAIMRPKG
jgi:hypothetical protein